MSHHSLSLACASPIDIHTSRDYCRQHMLFQEYIQLYATIQQPGDQPNAIKSTGQYLHAYTRGSMRGAKPVRLMLVL
jgi:hypothetical protein